MASGEDGRAVLLCGMMGSGKSSVGRLLAGRLGWSFIDTDERVEAQDGMRIPEIFSREGEPGFRKRERSVLEALPEHDCVIALGGGAVAAPENRAILRRKGTLVWLQTRVETLADRLGDACERPLLAGLDREGRIAKLRELLAERAAAYAEASVRIDTDGCDVQAVGDAVLAALGREDAA